MENEPNFDNAVRFAKDALYNARTTKHLCLAADTLLRNILVIANNQSAEVTPTSWAGLVKEIGCHYLDFGPPEYFSRCRKLGERLLAGRMTNEDVTTRLRIEQHHGFELCLEGRLGEGEDCLAETTEKMMKCGYDVGFANNQQHILAAEIRAGNLNRADEVLERLEKKVGKIEPPTSIKLRNSNQINEGRVTPWTAYGILLRKADLHLNKDDEGVAFEYVEGAESMARFCGIRCTGMLSSDALNAYRQKVQPRRADREVCHRCILYGPAFFQYAGKILDRLEAFEFPN